MKFLVDECLSPALVDLAHVAGFEAYHVAHRGWGGLKDPQLLVHILNEDLVLVTNNRADFIALLGGSEVHPGLIVILENVRRDEQVACFKAALSAILDQGSMVNRVAEVDKHCEVHFFDLPGAP